MCFENHNSIHNHCFILNKTNLFSVADNIYKYNKFSFPHVFNFVLHIVIITFIFWHIHFTYVYNTYYYYYISVYIYFAHRCLQFR